MRARNREINIFNMSLLDILCGALGAFCFMMLTLFPYYSKAHKEDAAPSANSAELQRQVDRAQRRLQETEQRIRQLEAESARASGGGGASSQQLQQAWNQMQSLRQELQEASQKIEKLEVRFPVAVDIMWITDKHDVDIYLWRPATKRQPEPALDHKNNVWINGDSRTDWVSGPGFEAWQMRDLPRGTAAKLYYILYNSNGNSGPAFVAGNILCPDGSLRIPPVQMDQQSRILHVVDLTRNDKDELQLHWTPEFQQHQVGRSRPSAALRLPSQQAGVAFHRPGQELQLFMRPTQ